MNGFLKSRSLLSISLVLTIGVTGWLIHDLMFDSTVSATPKNPQGATLTEMFEQAVYHLHLRQYERALGEFDEVLRQQPGLVEAHVDRGFSLIGLKRYDESRSAFEKAIELRPSQANSYFGLAISLEGSGDLLAARGAMKTFVHLMPNDNAYRRKAEAAIWEWSEAIERDGQNL
jgi:tetratricopeptide (TPR) repeat protein